MNKVIYESDRNSVIAGRRLNLGELLVQGITLFSIMFTLITLAVWATR